MPKEKIQSNSEERDLAMARQSLGRVKELDLSPEQKETVMNMIKQAKMLESEKKLHKALLIYNQLAEMLKNIKLRNESSLLSGIKPKEFWDWKVDKKLLERADSAKIKLEYGTIKDELSSFSKTGEDIIEMFGTDTAWLVCKNGKTIFLGDDIFHNGAISENGQHFAAVFNMAVSGEVEYEVQTDQKIWDMKFSQEIRKVLFSPDGKKLAAFSPIETFKPENPYFYIYENEEFLFLNLLNDEFRRDLRLKDFVYSPDSQKSAAIFHEIDEDLDVETSIVVDGDERWEPQAATLKWPVYSPDGNKLAVVDREGRIMVNQKYIGMVSGKKALMPPVFSPNGEKIAYVCKSHSAVASVALAENDQIIWSSRKKIHDVTYSDDGKNIAAAVVPFNAKTSKMVIAINGIVIDDDEYPEINHLTWSPNNEKIMFVGRQGNQYFRVVKNVSKFVR